MAADEEKNCLALRGIKIQTLQGSLRDLKARLHVALAGRALAYIVQEQGQVKELRAFEFGEQLGIALIPLRLRLLQAMQALDADERMFVYREAMIVIAHHQGVDQLEFRQQ